MNSLLISMKETKHYFCQSIGSKQRHGASTCKDFASFRMHIDEHYFVLTGPLIQSTAGLESLPEYYSKSLFDEYCDDTVVDPRLVMHVRMDRILSGSTIRWARISCH